MPKSKKTFYAGEAGVPQDLAEFQLSAVNACGYFWERREPGTDADQTFETGAYEYPTLTDAVEAAMPFYQEYELTLDRAAHLCLRLGLVLGTGMPVDEFDELEDSDA